MAEWFRALDLKSGDPFFKSSTLLLSGFVLGSPLLRCVSSQLVNVIFAIFGYLFVYLFIYNPSENLILRRNSYPNL